ncbi:PrgI family protein [Arcanobacterium phocisimile]|uniref:PrgI family protein n=2 Tax=Arcanobacterium TaxID=28263 RepID=A0A6H2EN66_9ACTO|nr:MULTISPECIES: PrgI family protein [Arcanobacterium]QJC22516.1 PrgI family protein [Arcanobacterium buesumense]QRV02070.1 PrgI family protein [Arcanobacterium phocisimile]
MALEVRVPREVTAYQPRVLFGMSWRQLGVAALAAPLIAGSFAVCYLAGYENLGVVIVTLLSVPAVALGWVRPMGVPFEKYFSYAWDWRQGKKVFVFEQDLMEEENGRQKNGRKSCPPEAGN